MKTMIAILGLMTMSSTVFARGAITDAEWSSLRVEAKLAADRAYINADKALGLSQPEREAVIGFSAKLIMCGDVKLQSEGCTDAIKYALAAGISQDQVVDTLKRKVEALEAAQTVAQPKEFSEEQVNAVRQEALSK